MCFTGSSFFRVVTRRLLFCLSPRFLLPSISSDWRSRGSSVLEIYWVFKNIIWLFLVCADYYDFFSSSHLVLQSCYRYMTWYTSTFLWNKDPFCRSKFFNFGYRGYSRLLYCSFGTNNYLWVGLLVTRPNFEDLIYSSRVWVGSQNLTCRFRTLKMTRLRCREKWNPIIYITNDFRIPPLESLFTFTPICNTTFSSIPILTDELTRSPFTQLVKILGPIKHKPDKTF